MRLRISTIMATASMLALATAAAAQPAPRATGAPAAEEATLGEIVVTARRKSESLQEVPQVVNAVTADTLKKLNIQQFADVQSVVPGLSLSTNQTGFGQTASMRGVTFNVQTAAQPTVAMYLNDAPVGANYVFQSLFDVGQIEILRGPQGTTRGISAPSGAITVTLRKPDLSNFGGYFDGSLTDLQGRNAQGALNIPIIKDVLAVRVAALVDQNSFDGVTSVNSRLRPGQTTTAERFSVSYEPNDHFNANVVYQHLDRSLTSFSQMFGPGNGTAADPPLTPEDRAGVQDGARRAHEHQDVVTAVMDSRIFGQHLSYVGSYTHSKNASMVPEDQSNVLPNFERYQTSNGFGEETTQEIRLASDPAPGRFFDYTVGAFYKWTSGNSLVNQVGSYFAGAFGRPGGPINVNAFDPRYVAEVHIAVPGTYQETSVFGSLTLHLGDKTELTGGVRHIMAVQSSTADLELGSALLARAIPVPCSLIRFGSTYPGTCDIPIAASTIQNLSRHTSADPNIYNVSLSHHLTRDVLIYANTGTAFRPGPTAVGLRNPTNNPVLNSLIFLEPETSRSYEVGFKSTFLDGRARLNLALWRQHFHNTFIFTPGVPYADLVSNSVSSFSFTSNADATVSGIDLDTAFQITPNWNIGFQYSYADGHVDQGSQVPCNDSNLDGIADGGAVTSIAQLGGQVIRFCNGGATSRNPLWNATIQSEYTHPVSDGVNGFIRGLVTYYPENKRAEPGFTVDNYSLVNLYAGVRSEDGAWEVSLFARNTFGNDTLLDRDTQTRSYGALNTFFPTNSTSTYRQVTGYTPRREVGVHVNYAWGSR